MAERNTRETPEHIRYFPWLRAAGAVGIVLLHAVITMRGVPNITIQEPLGLLSGLLMIVCGRWAVPAFFMMSGALMLDPQREMGWRKLLGHVWRLGFALLTFGYVFCLIEAYVDYGGMSASVAWRAFVRLACQHSWDHLWFVYQLLGFYLVTPLIRPWVAQASRAELRNVTLVACVLLLGLKGLSMYAGSYSIYYGFEVPHCFAYYLLGYYAHRYLRLDLRWMAWGLLSLVTTIVMWRVFGQLWVTDPNRGVVAPFAVMVFLAAKRYLDVPVRHCWPVALLADYSFGIYLVHPAFQHLLALVPGMGSLPASAVLVLMILVPLVLSVATIWLLRWIPGFRGKV